MNRRKAVAATLSPLALGAVPLSACDGRLQSSSTEQLAVPPFSPKLLHHELDLLASAYSAKSPATLQHLRPGLSEPQIREGTAWFPHPLPPEVASLYQWRNGYSAPEGSDVTPFMFRDYVFLPLEQVQAEYRSMNDTYGRNPQDAELLASSFPFASLGGGWLVVSASKQRLMPDLERPVISVFQGVSVFFYSMEKMAQTCVQWLSHPKHNGIFISPKAEMEVWQKVNPGIFPE